jgi:hypothetical protein
VPTPTTRAAGTRLTGAIWQADVTDTATYLLNPPEFAGYQGAVQSVPNTTWTALLLDQEHLDSYSGHSTSSNTSRYVAQVAGWYLVCGVYAPAINATGFRAARIQKNGSPILGHAAYLPNASGSVEMGVVTPTKCVQLAVNDYVEVAGYQSSGGALNTILDADLRTGLWVRWSHAV